MNSLHRKSTESERSDPTDQSKGKGDSPDPAPHSPQALATLALNIKQWARELGFDAVGISDIDLSEAEDGLRSWLDAGYHGEMDYMEKHGLRRARPAELVPGTLRVVSVRLPYLPASVFAPRQHDESPIDEVAGESSHLLGARANSNAERQPTNADDAARERETNRNNEIDAGAHPHSIQPSSTPPRDPALMPALMPDWRGREQARLDDAQQAVVSVYARGRDYHKVLRQRLQRLADRIQGEVGTFGYRVFTDSAPVMEVELARRAGVGWRGKHTLLLSRDAGSFFFLGELYVDIPLPADAETRPDLPADDGERCGQCRRCIDVCPTGAIVAPYRLDARKCLSYLTIEYAGSIPEIYRRAMGNRIYGCDDCQIICPWNKFAKAAPVDDFDTRNNLDKATLIELFAWTEDEFNARLTGSAIRRIGHERWQRNIAVALGNALRDEGLTPTSRLAVQTALTARRAQASPLVQEHIDWALDSKH